MVCTLCGKETTSTSHVAEQWLLDLIRERNPDWVTEDGGCDRCIEHYRGLEDAVEIVE